MNNVRKFESLDSHQTRVQRQEREKAGLVQLLRAMVKKFLGCEGRVLLSPLDLEGVEGGTLSFGTVLGGGVEMTYVE